MSNTDVIAVPQKGGGKKYYISGKKYTPDKSYLLCHHTEWNEGDGALQHCMGFTEYTDIYATMNKAFFMVKGIEGEDGEQVTILSRDGAEGIMDMYTSEIITDNYDKVLGEPEEG